MGIFQYLLLCAVLGGAYWLIFVWGFPQIADIIKKIALIAIVILLIVVLLNALGLFSFADVPIPNLGRRNG